MRVSDLSEYWCCDRFEVVRRGERVWVNGYTGLMGRFGPRGIDVHSQSNFRGTRVLFLYKFRSASASVRGKRNRLLQNMYK